MIGRNKISRESAPIVALVGLAIAAALPEAAAQTPGCPSLEPNSVLQVRVLEDIDSTISKVGDTFDATVVGQLSPEGEVLASSPALVTVRLVKVVQPKEDPENPVLALKLVEIDQNGKACPIATGFGEIGSGFMRVHKGDAQVGTTSEKAVEDIITSDGILEGGVATVVNGAGVSFEIASGHEVKVTKNVTLNFEVAPAPHRSIIPLFHHSPHN